MATNKAKLALDPLLRDCCALANAVVNRVFTPTDAARLCCPVFVFGHTEAEKMERSRRLLERLLKDPVALGEVAEALKAIWKKK